MYVCCKPFVQHFHRQCETTHGIQKKIYSIQQKKNERKDVMESNIFNGGLDYIYLG